MIDLDKIVDKKRGMTVGSLIALIIAFGALIIGFIGEGGHVGALISWTPAVIVFGGTIGSVMLSFPMEKLKKTNRLLKEAFSSKPKDMEQLVSYFRDLSIRTRRDEILAAETEIAEGSTVDPFIQKGIKLMLEGLTTEMIRETLEIEIDSIAQEKKTGASIFESAGGTAPTMGIVGTVLGLVHVLGGLADADMSQLGHSISSAFLATLYGLASANLLFLPLSTRLKNIAEEDLKEKELIMEAVLMINERVSTSILIEKLNGFLAGEDIRTEPSQPKMAESNKIEATV